MKVLCESGSIDLNLGLSWHCFFVFHVFPFHWLHSYFSSIINMFCYVLAWLQSISLHFPCHVFMFFYFILLNIYTINSDMPWYLLKWGNMVHHRIWIFRLKLLWIHFRSDLTVIWHCVRGALYFNKKTEATVHFRRRPTGDSRANCALDRIYIYAGWKN